MIVITGLSGTLSDAVQLTPEEKRIVEEKERSPVTYRYGSVEELLFELRGRVLVARAAEALYASGAGFAVFSETRCNERYWERTDNGGFRLRPNVLPSEAVADIYENGHLYAFECATAIIIVFYKAVLDLIGPAIFNRRFADLYIRDWQYDKDLRLILENDPNLAYTGDVLYFRNPEVDPAHMEWQGENAVILGNGLFFGHGMGIVTSGQIIASLNRNRRPGATRSAYLANEVLTIDYRDLYRLMKAEQTGLTRTGKARPLLVTIGARHYVAFAC